MFEKNSNLISNLVFYFRILFLVRVLSISCVLSFSYIFVVHTIAVTKMEINEPAKKYHKGEKIRSYTISFKLEVVEFAENRSITAAAQKYNVDRHSVRDWKKKKNELQELSSSVNIKKRIRLGGGVRKPLSEEMEETLLEWIIERRSKMLRVSRRIIRKKAVIIYGDLKRIDPDRFDEKFEAINGWLFKFMKRHNLSLRRKTSVAQKDPDLLITNQVFIPTI